MKNWISSQFSTISEKKVLSSITIAALITNIFSPILTYAASLPTFWNTETHPNVYAVAQVSEVSLPRDFVTWDHVQITLSWAISWNKTYSVDFSWSNLETADNLASLIDTESDYLASYDDSIKKITITSENPWIPFIVWQLITDRTGINSAITVNNVVAVAQQSELSIPQDLLAWDVINFTLDWTPISQNFNTDKDTTLQDFANKITTLTNSSWTYDSANSKINMISKTPGQAFSMWTLTITSSWISSINTQINIVPVKQVETIDFPRNLYSDETLSFTISWSTINQPYNTNYITTLTNLSQQIDALSFVDSSYTWWTLSIVSSVAGSSIPTGQIMISGWTLTWYTSVQNQVAIAQEDTVVIPRDLLIWDTVHMNIWATSLSQDYSLSSANTISLLMDQIDALPNVWVKSYSPAQRAIVIQSKIPGTPFGPTTVYIASAFSSTIQTANVTAEKQIDEYTMPRTLVSWDTISVIINWSPYEVSFSGSSSQTVQDLADIIKTSLSWSLDIVNTANKITITANTAWISFGAGQLNITTWILPTVIVPNIVPVKQREILSFANDFISWDVITLTVAWNSITQNFDTDNDTTLTDLNNQINWLVEVNSTVNLWTKTITIDSSTAWTSFAVSDAVTTWSWFTSSPVTANQSQVKASIDISIDWPIFAWDNFTVWDCTINFVSAGWTFDFDCADGSATIDILSLNTSDLAQIITSVYNIHDTTTTPAGTRTLQDVATWNVITYSTSSSEISTENINFAASWNISAINWAPSQIDTAQVDTLTLPRDFAVWDSFQITIDWITVTQNFLTDSSTSLTNLVNQINALPSVNATNIWNVITITAATAWIWFSVWNGSFVNTKASTMTITNVAAQAQKMKADLPTSLISWDEMTVSIDWTEIKRTFASDSLTTLTNLASDITSWTQVNATLSWSLTLVLEAKNAWTSFTVDKIEIKNASSSNTVQISVSAVAQVSTLTIPFVPVSWDNIDIKINWNTITQPFTSDLLTTYSLLNTQIDSQAWVTSSVDTTSWIFTITSEVPWTAFTASWIFTIDTISSTNDVPNTDSWAQVDSITIWREMEVWDVFDISVAGYTWSINFNTDKTTTIQNIATWIDSLSEVDAVFDWNQTITITTATPWIGFSSAVISVNTSYSSVTQTANVPAQAKIDTITIPRTLFPWDSLSVDIDSNMISTTYTWSSAATIQNFVDAINSSQSGSIASVIWNIITLTATTAWIPFAVWTWSFVIENDSVWNTTVNNVIAVKQQSEFDLPNLVEWDMIMFTLEWAPIITNFTQDHNTTVNQMISSINWTALAIATISWSTMNLTSTVAWTPFSLSQIAIRNTVSPVLKIANVVPESQVVDFNPAWSLREWITFRLTLNWNDYDYLTARYDTNDEIINNLAAQISVNNTVIVSTWSNVITLTAAVPWTPFTYSSQTMDITAPVITSTINTPERLKSGSTSNSNVQINEDGDIYLVLSWTVINTRNDITFAIAAWTAFIWSSPASAYSDYTITVPTWVVDWLYNFIAVDPYDNVSQAVDWWLTVDNTPPAVNISTPTQTVNTDTIVVSWITEANTPVSIIWWIWTVNTVSDWAWAFSWVVTLNQNVSNTITANATDIAWNIWSGNVIIIHDSITPQPLILNYPNYSNTWTVNVWITTETWILAEIYSWATLVSSWITDWSWMISLGVNLDLNTTNNFHVVVTDAGWNTNSWNISIIQDSIAPNIVFSPYQSLIHAASINISWTTEPFSSVTLSNWTFNTTVNADNMWDWTANIWLTQIPWAQTVNNISVFSTDPAWNTTATWISITEDSIANTLNILNPSPFYTSDPNITISWSTRSSSTVTLSWVVSAMPTIIDWLGNFSIDAVLNTNATNNIDITSVDVVGNTVIANIQVIHDDITPTVNISTSNTPTNNINITLDWTTEANSTISITWWSWTFGSVSDGSGNFSIPISLNQWVTNVLTITSTDMAWNSWSNIWGIVQDPVVNTLVINNPPISYTNTWSITFSWITKPNANVTVSWWLSNLNLVADSMGIFSWSVNLINNSTNVIDISSIDNTLTTISSNFTVIHDDISPFITLDQSWTIYTNQASYNLTWFAEANSNLVFSNWTSNITATASSTWSFSIMFPLTPNSSNWIFVQATDLAWNNSIWFVWVNIIHDDIAPTVSQLNVWTSVTWLVMNVNYSFNTNETSTSTFYIWSWSNVLATLISSWTTLWVSHSWIIPWLTPNTTYFYFISSSDALWNTYQSPISTVNFVDNTAPVVLSKFISNIDVSWATLDFSFSDSHFNPATLASWQVSITDGITTNNIIPSLTYSNPTNTWSAIFTWLNSGTLYTYTINLTDDFWNTSSSSWAFMTSNNITLSWTTVTQTWSITLPVWTWWTTSLSWTTVIINSDPNSSWVPNWSIIIPWNIDIISWNWWNWTISAPVIISSSDSNSATNSEIQGLITPLNTANTTYTASVLETVFAWWNTNLTASWWYFTITVWFQNNLVWQNLRIFNSQNGSTWINNNPDNTCTVATNNTCTFRAITLWFFSFASLNSTTININPIPTWTTSGGGGGWSIRDFCPNWDYSSSYYDRTCWTKPAQNTSTWTTTEIDKTWDTTTGQSSSAIQTANKIILDIKQQFYPTTVTIDQKIDLWKKVIEKVTNKLEQDNISQKNKDIYIEIINKSEEIIRTLENQKSSETKIIDKDSWNDNIVNSSDSNQQIIESDKDLDISLIRYIEVEHVVVVRDAPSYRWKIIAYLPRNYKTEVLRLNTIWSKLRLLDGKIAYIRTKYLREENRQDRWRSISYMVFYDVTLQANVDMRKVKVARSLFVRKWPSVDNKIVWVLKKDEKILVLDNKTTNWWYEIRWVWGTWWINGKYVNNTETK